MEEREAILRRWFSMWLEGKDQGIAALFQEDALYIVQESAYKAGAPSIRALRRSSTGLPNGTPGAGSSGGTWGSVFTGRRRPW